MYPIASCNAIQIVKPEPGHDNINYFRTHLNEQKQEYQQQINLLQKTHEEQVFKLCNELNKSSSLIQQYKIELDSMRTVLATKEKLIKTNYNEPSSDQILQTQNIRLSAENKKLKKDLVLLATKYQTLFNEMQDARQYVMKMIDGLD